MKLASFEWPEEWDYRDLTIAISASMLMKLWSICRDLSLRKTSFCAKSYRHFQNSAEFWSLEIGYAKIFNFSPNVCTLSNSISRDSACSPDSNHTKYINYGCELREKVPIIFP